MSAKTQRLAIDLERNEELAVLVADLEPGAKLEATLSIVARDDKTLTVEVESVEECGGGEKAKDEEADEADDDETEGETPAVKVARGSA